MVLHQEQEVSVVPLHPANTVLPQVQEVSVAPLHLVNTVPHQDSVVLQLHLLSTELQLVVLEDLVLLLHNTVHQAPVDHKVVMEAHPLEVSGLALPPSSTAPQPAVEAQPVVPLPNMVLQAHLVDSSLLV
uniref:Uncharacterized protein n=1 Tax=Cacopsylla melanoneura TaxID=428564 RepID=A0A8D8LS13_9HEMI